MPRNAGSYLRSGAVERVFGRVLAYLVWIGLIRGHFYVLEVRGRKSGKTFTLPVDPIEFKGLHYLVLRPRQFQLGAQCPHSRRSRASPRDAPPPLCGARTSPRHALADPQSLSRPIRRRGAALLPRTQGVAGGSIQ
jgi:hypothetical protein